MVIRGGRGSDGGAGGRSSAGRISQVTRQEPNFAEIGIDVLGRFGGACGSSNWIGPLTIGSGVAGILFPNCARLVAVARSKLIELLPYQMSYSLRPERRCLVAHAHLRASVKPRDLLCLR